MEIILAMAQRKCSYEGEYGPECLAAMTEYESSEKAAYIEDAINNGLKSGEFASVQQIVLTVNDKSIDAALFPNIEPIKAEVLINNGKGGAQ